jgi:hypothetical protein
MVSRTYTIRKIERGDRGKYARFAQNARDRGDIDEAATLRGHPNGPRTGSSRSPGGAAPRSLQVDPLLDQAAIWRAERVYEREGLPRRLGNGRREAHVTAAANHLRRAMDHAGGWRADEQRRLGRRAHR